MCGGVCLGMDGVKACVIAKLSVRNHARGLYQVFGVMSCEYTIIRM